MSEHSLADSLALASCANKKKTKHCYLGLRFVRRRNREGHHATAAAHHLDFLVTGHAFVVVRRRCFAMIHRFYIRALPLVVVPVADAVAVFIICISMILVTMIFNSS